MSLYCRKAGVRIRTRVRIRIRVKVMIRKAP
jgi:hypothetical protein